MDLGTRLKKPVTDPHLHPKFINSACLMVKCYMSLVADIAEMYTKVSRKYITAGLTMCNELSMACKANDSGEMAKRRRILESFMDTAQKGIMDITAKV